MSIRSSLIQVPLLLFKTAYKQYNFGLCVAVSSLLVWYSVPVPQPAGSGTCSVTSSSSGATDEFSPSQAAIWSVPPREPVADPPGRRAGVYEATQRAGRGARSVAALFCCSTTMAPGSIWWSIERKNNQPHPARKLWKCFFSPPLTQARLLAPFEMWGQPEWPDRAVPHTDPRYCRCSEQHSGAPGASSHTSLMRVYLRHPAYLTFSFWETLKSIWVSHFSV